MGAGAGVGLTGLGGCWLGAAETLAAARARMAAKVVNCILARDSSEAKDFAFARSSWLN